MRVGSKDFCVWRALAALLVVVGSSAGKMCLTEECAKEVQIHRLELFFRSVAPEPREAALSLKDVGQYVSRGVSRYLEGFWNTDEGQDKKEGRQYYGTTGYNYYGNTGHGVYGGGSSSTSYNGLDAALSALAFLAFGVWLFNLVLPKLQGSALGLPGLGRAPSFIERNHSDSFAPAGLLSQIYTNSQDLVNKIFSQGSLSSSRELVTKWFGRQLLNTATDFLASAIGSLDEILRDPSTDYTSRAFLSKETTGRFRRWIASGGQGMLDHVVNYLARMLFSPPTEHGFPDSRKQETTNT